MATGEFDKPGSLPSYPEMILGAIESLNNQNGSNKSSISKYIESKYGELPPSHSTLLSQYLNKMKESGELVFFKNSYTKRDPNAPPRRSRGRPPKPKAQPSPGAVLSSFSPPRPRGRPPKDASASPRPKVAVKNASPGSGRPRGRPPKKARTETESAPKPAGGSGRGRGRPPKVKAPFTEANV